MFQRYAKLFAVFQQTLIIVGVWKEASRITALAPDLINRCEHIDIGSWNDDELDLVIKKGEKALNISIDIVAQTRLKECCANNVGIFKTFLLKLVQQYGIYATQDIPRLLNSQSTLDKVLDSVIKEAYTPLVDRIKNLALPQRNKKGSKRMRLKIIIAILHLIKKMDIKKTQRGISVENIKAGVDEICDMWKENRIDISNITQELGVIHQREENRQAGENFIPLFYFDKANRKLLVIEPSLYEVKAYKAELIDDIIQTVLEAEVEYLNRR